MRVLIVKMSSLGDIVHTFPALTDAARVINGIQFDWVVEQDFEQIPGWHPAVDQIISGATRHWRRSLLKTWLAGDWRQFSKRLRAHQYDKVIDAQGLIKSALITRKALGEKHGPDQQSAKEPLSSRCYNVAHQIDKRQHAIQRTRQLFSKALGYSLDGLPLQYGLSMMADLSVTRQSILFVHGTAWQSKRWPLSFWSALAKLVSGAGYQVLVPAVNDTERNFAEAVADDSTTVSVLAKKSLSEMAAVIKAVSGIVAVDTGLAHLATALDVPTVALYGATNARLTGISGARQRSLQAEIECSPCLRRQCPRLSRKMVAAPCTETLSAVDVWCALQEEL